MQQKNYYEILGVSENASSEEIKNAYRRLAKEFHPDRNQGDPSAEARFKEINEANEVLGDAEKRKKYDELRHYSAHGFSGASMSYEEFMRRFGGTPSFKDAGEAPSWGFAGSTLDDIFSNLFGRQGTKRVRPRSQSYEYHFASGRKQSVDPQPTADPFFKRKGLDAYVDITINIAQVLLGSKVKVRTPPGHSIHVRIPQGTQPSAVLRIRGMGFHEHSSKGDLYIRTHLEIPSGLTEQQKEHAVQLARSLHLKF